MEQYHRDGEGVCWREAKGLPPARRRLSSSYPSGRREQQEVLDLRRQEQQTEKWKKRYDTRASVEGTISQAVHRTGIRRTRFTGLARTHLGNVLAATAINIIRLDAWLTGTPLGGTRAELAA